MALIVTDQSGNQYSLTVNSADGSLQTTPVSNVAPSTSDNSIFVSALWLITSALRLIGVIGTGELPTSDESLDGLAAFQQMIDAWNAERLTIYAMTSADYPFVLGQQAYTMGPGGAFNTNRPARIVGMSAILLTNPANPVEIPIPMYTWSDWQKKISVKAVDSSFPLACYDDGNMPLRTLNFWPTPTQANNVRIYSWQPLIWPAALTTMLNFPPGYAEAFRYNLAVRLAPEFSQQIPQSVGAIAVESLARIRNMNAPSLELTSDLLATPAGYNYKADLFGIGF